MSAQVAADLRAAADVLERDGWVQRDWGSADGCKCALGAVAAVCSGGITVEFDSLERADAPRAQAAGRALLDAISRDRDGFVDAEVTRWNDTPGRTADEVIAALRAAAARAEAAS